MTRNPNEFSADLNGSNVAADDIPNVLAGVQSALTAIRGQSSSGAISGYIRIHTTEVMVPAYAGATAQDGTASPATDAATA